MNKLQTHLRQGRILHAALGGTRISTSELIKQLGVSSATFEREVQALRAQGFDIHSRKRQLTLTSPSPDAVVRFTAGLVREILDPSVLERAVELQISALPVALLESIVTISEAIRSGQMVRATYTAIGKTKSTTFTLAPLAIVPTLHDLRFIAADHEKKGVVKQFLLDRLSNVNLLNEKHKYKVNVKEFYEHSWELWAGAGTVDASVQFFGDAAAFVQSRTWMKDAEGTRAADGSVILNLRLNTIEEFGNWLLRFGQEAIVLEPKELREYVLTTAWGILNANR